MAHAQIYATPASLFDITRDNMDPDPCDMSSGSDDHDQNSPESLFIQDFTPLSTRHPRTKDWEHHKETIRTLYLDERLTLAKVRKHMKQHHGFVATVKMYKDRFRNWKFRKNYRRKDVYGFLESYVPDEATTPIFYDHPVEWPRIERVKRLTGKVQKPPHSPKPRKKPTGSSSGRNRASSSASSHADEEIRRASQPMCHMSISELYSPIDPGCRTFILLEDYLDGRLFGSLVDHFFGPVKLFAPADGISAASVYHPSRLNQNYARGMALLRDNRARLASVLLARAASALEHLFIIHHPSFASCFLDAFVGTKHEHQQGMSGYVTDQAVQASSKALGDGHPLTLLCRFVQSTTQNEERMEQLLFFCAKFCQLFSDRLGKKHRVSAYVNLKHFEKLLQLHRLDQAYDHFNDYVEPVFADFIASGTIPRKMRAPCLCFLRRKAHLLSLVGDRDGAVSALRLCANYAVEWLGEREVSIAGNPVMEECFRLLDEIAEFLFNNGQTVKGIDLHSFAIGLCAAVRGEREGKAIRMISAQLARYTAVGMDDRVRIMQIRFPNLFADETGCTVEAMDHILPCPTCANGPDTQLWCEEHLMQEHVSPQGKLHDQVLIRLTRECLADLLKWFASTTT